MVRVSPLSVVVLSLMVCVFASAGPVWQTDPVGQAPTTYQLWTFDSPINPAIPEVVANEYGVGAATIEGLPSDTFGWYSTYDGREGVWHAEELTVNLTIPNRPVQDEYKEIWLSVIFQTTLSAAHVTPVPAADAVIPLGQTVTDLGDGWSQLDIGWRVEPNPSSEIICMSFSGTGGSVDQIEVQTICVPEPLTLALLGLGGLLMRRRR